MAAVDSFGHTPAFGWTATCPGAASGTFNNASLAMATWTAPTNTTTAVLACTLRVTGTDGHGLTTVRTYAQTVNPVPRIASFTPTSGPVGTPVTITGVNLSRATAVTFTGPVSVTPSATPTALVASVPAGAVTGVLSVTTSEGTPTSAVAFRVLPRITSFSPASAAAKSSTVITVVGTNLKVGQAVPIVKIGPSILPPAAIQSSTPTELQFTVPLGPTTGKISVMTTDGTAISADTLVVIQPPRPMTFVPVAAPVGTPVTINGLNLAGATEVIFTGPVSVTPTAVTATSLKVVVPAGARTGPVSVTSAAGTVATPSAFKVQPRIDLLAPTTVVAGSDTIVSVTGTNLVAATGVPLVKVGAFTIPAPSVPTATASLIQLRVPLGAVTGKVSVTTIDGTATSTTILTLLQPPRPTALVPAAAPVGALVTINGLYLDGATGVTFAGPVTVTPTAVTATSVKAIVPLGALTGVVRVTNPVGTGTTAGVFKVQPRITGFAPSSAAAGSQTVVSVTGTNLLAASGAPVVKIGAFTIPPASVATATATLIQLRVPLGAVTGPIGVTTIDATATSAAPLVVIQPPHVTSLTPTSGTVGALVTIGGTSLLGTTAVTFTGPVTVTPTAVTATSLKALVPAGAQTGPISVTNSAGTGASTTSFKLLPRIAGFTPAEGQAGDAVVVTGSNLTVGANHPIVKVGAFPATVVASSATEVTFTIPGPAGTAKVNLATSDGAATSATALTVTTPALPDLAVLGVMAPPVAVTTPRTVPSPFTLARVPARLVERHSRGEVVRLGGTEHEIEREPEHLADRVEDDWHQHHEHPAADEQQRPRRIGPGGQQRQQHSHPEDRLGHQEVQRVGAEPVVVLLVVAALEAKTTGLAAGTDGEPRRQDGAHTTVRASSPERAAERSQERRTPWIHRAAPRVRPGARPGRDPA